MNNRGEPRGRKERALHPITRLLPAALLMAAALTTGLFAGAASSFHNFAQVGVGGGIQSVFLVFNPNEESVAITLQFYNESGGAMTVAIGGSSGSNFDFEVSAGGSRRLVATATSVEAGWAKLTAAKPVGAQLLFEILQDGNLVTQAAVEDLGSVKFADVFVEQKAGSGTGLAVANLSTVGKVLIKLSLRDENGAEVATADLELEKLGHAAKFVSELFPGVAFERGTLHIRASGRLAIITLQQTGLVIGTLPVITLPLSLFRVIS